MGLRTGAKPGLPTLAATLHVPNDGIARVDIQNDVNLQSLVLGFAGPRNRPNFKAAQA